MTNLYPRNNSCSIIEAPTPSVSQIDAVEIETSIIGAEVIELSQIEAGSVVTEIELAPLAVSKLHLFEDQITLIRILLDIYTSTNLLITLAEEFLITLDGEYLEYVE